MKFITEHANSKFVLNRFLPNSSLVSMLSIFFLLYGCGKKRAINVDQLVSMQYAIGEKIPYTGVAIELYDNGKIKYEYQYENFDTVKSMLSLGGYRLARVLDYIFN